PYTDGFIYKYDTSKWFLLPKDLFAYKYYNELGNQTKLFFAILYNTFRYSEKQGKYIHNGKIYCSLTYNKIQEITGFRREKIKEMKEELREKHLITYENGGFSKADRFYVHLPQISSNMEITDSNTWNHLKKKSIEMKYKNIKLISDINHNPKIRGYKLRHDAEVTKRNRWKSQNGTNRSNKTELIEVTKRNPNNTYIIKPYFNNLYINKTTTKLKNQKNCGSGSKHTNDIILKIKNEYQIHKLTKTYERKIQAFSNIFSLDIMHYAIEYSGEKAVTSPTNLLLTILSNWEQAGVKTLEQAKAQENNYKNRTGANYVSSKSKSIERTPQWLLDQKTEKSSNKYQDEMTEEEKIAFEKEKEALLKEMKAFWT
ncbi:MAG: replication initiator protein A, partial [Staphylococcus equorum]